MGNITIYIDYASGAGYWSTYIRGGANNWMYPGSGMENPIYIKFVESSYGSNMDFYSRKRGQYGNELRDGVLAVTIFMDSNE